MWPGNAQHGFWRALAAMVMFLLGFGVLITVISRHFLIPALIAARDATPLEKSQLSAYALLLMTIVLIIVIVGLILTFRVHRFFFPRSTGNSAPTKYVDAWAESGRRMENLPDNFDEPPAEIR